MYIYHVLATVCLVNWPAPTFTPGPCRCGSRRYSVFPVSPPSLLQGSSHGPATTTFPPKPPPPHSTLRPVLESLTLPSLDLDVVQHRHALSLSSGSTDHDPRTSLSPGALHPIRHPRPPFPPPRHTPPRPGTVSVFFPRRRRPRKPTRGHQRRRDENYHRHNNEAFIPRR